MLEHSFVLPDTLFKDPPTACSFNFYFDVFFFFEIFDIQDLFPWLFGNGPLNFLSIISAAG